MKTINEKKHNKAHSCRQAGFTLVEVLVACAIISISTFALMNAAAQGIQLSNQALRQSQASFLLEEGAEAVKSIRDTDIPSTPSNIKGWTTISNLTLDTNYYLTFNTGTNTWSLGTNPTGTIDGLFTRSITFSGVSRDANDDIVTSGGTYDDVGTRKVSVTVSWPLSDGSISTKNLDFYISDIFD